MKGMITGTFLTFTDSGDAVEDVATATLTAIGAHKVNTAMASTYTIRLLTLINV